MPYTRPHAKTNYRSDTQLAALEDRADKTKRLFVMTDVVDALLHGLSRKQIMAQFGYDYATIDAAIKDAYAEMAPNALGLLEQWKTTAILRSEIVMSRIMRSVYETPEEEDLDHRLVKDYVEVTKLQTEIIGATVALPKSDALLAGEGTAGGDAHFHVHFERTFTHSSGLYDRILEAAKEEVFGLPAPEVREGEDDEGMLSVARDRVEAAVKEGLVAREDPAEAEDKIAARFADIWNEANLENMNE